MVQIAPQKWLTVREAAHHASVSEDTIYRACACSDDKGLKHVRVAGRRAIRIKPEWIAAWLEKHAA